MYHHLFVVAVVLIVLFVFVLNKDKYVESQPICFVRIVPKTPPIKLQLKLTEIKLFDESDIKLNVSYIALSSTAYKASNCIDGIDTFCMSKVSDTSPKLTVGYDCSLRLFRIDVLGIDFPDMFYLQVFINKILIKRFSFEGSVNSHSFTLDECFLDITSNIVNTTSFFKIEQVNIFDENSDIIVPDFVKTTQSLLLIKYSCMKYVSLIRINDSQKMIKDFKIRMYDFDNIKLIKSASFTKQKPVYYFRMSPTCQVSYSTKVNDTCQSILQQYNITYDELTTQNPFLECNSFSITQQNICISSCKNTLYITSVNETCATLSMRFDIDKEWCSKFLTTTTVGRKVCLNQNRNKKYIVSWEQFKCVFENDINRVQNKNNTPIITQNHWDLYQSAKQDLLFDFRSIEEASLFFGNVKHEYGGYLDNMIENCAIRNNCPNYTTCASYGNIFYGRGPLQLTGCPNYREYKRYTGTDIVNLPELLLNNSSIHGWKSALMFWSKPTYNCEGAWIDDFTCREASKFGYVASVTNRINGEVECNKITTDVRQLARIEKIMNVRANCFNLSRISNNVIC